MLCIGCEKAREIPHETALERRKATKSSVMNMVASKDVVRTEAEHCYGTSR
jgi:hypothetical protein